MMRPAGFIARAAKAWRIGAPSAGMVATLIATSLAVIGFETAALFLFMPLLQSLGAPETPSGLARKWLAFLPFRGRTGGLIVLFCAAVAAKNGFALVSGYLSRRLEGQIAHDLRSQIFRRTLESCIDYRVDSKTSDLVTAAANHSFTVGQTITVLIRSVVSTSNLVVLSILLVVLSPSLSAAAAILLVLNGFLVRLAIRRAHTVGQAVVQENKDFGFRMWQNFTSLQLIRSFGREWDEATAFARESDRLRRRVLQMEMLWSMPGPLTEMLGVLVIAVLIAVSTRQQIGLASLGAFLVVLYRMQNPLRELMQSKVALDGLDAAVDDVDDVLKSSEGAYIRSGAVRLGSLRSGIEFRQVSFRYAPDQPPALAGLDFVIPKGRTTAIVGHSGAGKSTLISLLFRFHDPTSGEVLVDGAPLTTLDLAAWRSQIGVMSQDVLIFNDSVAMNVGYAEPKADLAAIRKACRIAGAEEFILDLPQGYETLLGERGMRLSGGQKQRIALARTLLRQPEILLLDEPTSALDPETERCFQIALDQYSRGRTLVVVAHRLSTVRKADQVVLIDHGRIVECGSPAELLARSSRFATFYGVVDGRAGLGSEVV